jgi:hypothetical protein
LYEAEIAALRRQIKVPMTSAERVRKLRARRLGP